MVKLTKKQKKFADLKLETDNGTQAALEVYDTKSYMTAANIASENLKKPKVIEYLESKAENAAIRVVELSEQDTNLPVALNASKDILDRSGYKPVEKSESKNVNLNFDVKIDSKKAKIKEKFEKELFESL